MSLHEDVRTCNRCGAVVDEIPVGSLRYCPNCEEWRLSTPRYLIAKCFKGHQMGEQRKTVRRILYGWCDECNDWRRLTYATPKPKRVENIESTLF